MQQQQPMQAHNQKAQRPVEKKYYDLHVPDTVPPTLTPTLPSFSPTSQRHELISVVNNSISCTISQAQLMRCSSGNCQVSVFCSSTSSQALPLLTTAWPAGRSQLKTLPLRRRCRMAGDSHAGPSNLPCHQAEGAAQPASGPPEAQTFEQWSAGAKITMLEERDGESNERTGESLPVSGPLGMPGDHQADLLSQHHRLVQAAARPVSSLLEGLRFDQWWAGAISMEAEGRDEVREKTREEMPPPAGCKDLREEKSAGKVMRKRDRIKSGGIMSGVHLRNEGLLGGAWKSGDAKVGPFGPQHSSREENREGVVATWGGSAASGAASARHVEGVRLLDGMEVDFLERPLNRGRDEMRVWAGMGGNRGSDSAAVRRAEGGGQLENSEAVRGKNSVGEEEKEEVNLRQLDLNHAPMWEALGVASGATTVEQLQMTYAVNRLAEGVQWAEQQGQEEQQVSAERQEKVGQQLHVQQQVQAERRLDGHLLAQQHVQHLLEATQNRFEMHGGSGTSAGAALGAVAAVMTGAGAPGDEVGVSGVGGGGGGRSQQLLQWSIGLGRFSSSSQSRFLAGSGLNPNPSNSADKRSNHPVRRRKQQTGSNGGGGGRRSRTEGKVAEKREHNKERIASKIRRKSKDISRGGSSEITSNGPGKRGEEAFRGFVNDEVAASLAMKEGEGGVMGEIGGVGGGRDHPGVKSGGEEGGSCGTGWTEERGVRQAGGSKRGREEPGVVSGGSADSAEIGALQKARRKPGPDRKSRPLTKVCVDSRVRECNVCTYSAPLLHSIRDFLCS